MRAKGDILTLLKGDIIKLLLQIGEGTAEQMYYDSYDYYFELDYHTGKFLWGKRIRF